MKNSAQIMNLPIVSISDGAQIGTVKTLVINPEKGSIDFLTVEQEDVQLSLKAIPFKKVIGIGEFAVTVESCHDVIDLSEIPIANQLVNKQIRVKNTKAMTRKGQLLGEVTEFFVDEETGEIIGVELDVGDRQAVLSSQFVLTYGKDILVVSEDAPSSLLAEARLLVSAKEQDDEETVENAPQNEYVDERHSGGEMVMEEAESKEALQALREKQMELLKGKRVTKDIVDKNGNTFIEAGTVLTEELIQKAQEEGPSVIVDISMNVEA
ncbi:PRC-barrel domain-containing protein [Parageobacillus sp. KH3-4]|jgi:uncharacterized protein YrrD|uniref:PRC-barrel domain-containing protein n=1 Tax=Parageobacillus sp. KH3-4 TaxID=2916802 RepID=UPI001FCCB87A|nr:PRC-barrel domain-containing protein [Parageobacillus sp. KH3-4]BDG46292.1 photosystem reaction center subunit H [Parageobacillus sp. KH3-4]